MLHSRGTLNVDETVYADAHVPPSSFTPINRPGDQPLTPWPSPHLPSSKQEDAVNNDRAKLHHPVIAHYLGLGADKEPANLARYAPVLPLTPTTPPKVLKRTRKVRDENLPQKGSYSSRPKKSKRTQATDKSRVITPAVRKSARDIENVNFLNVSASSPNGSKNGMDPPGQTDVCAVQVRHPRIEKGPVKLSGCNISTTLTHALPNYVVSSFNTPRPYVPSNATSETTIDFQSNGTIDDDFPENDDLFDAIDADSTADQCTANAKDSRAQKTVGIPGCQTSSQQADSSGTVCDDDVFSFLTPGLTDDFALPPFQLAVVDREPDPPVTERDSSEPAKIDSSSKVQGPSRKFKSPVTEKTEALPRNDIQVETANRKPIVRPRFPNPVRDRSPVIGLSASMLLRTCFRIGEAINQAGKVVRNGQNIMFELYARVRSSQRDAIKQHFLFSDLYHERPPYLKGEYDATLWKSVELFNYDSGRFLSKAKMCRCIGQMKRNNDKEWVLVILNIWEATWEDVEWVEGIVR